MNIKKDNPSKCFKRITFFCSWQYYHIFGENTEKIKLNGLEYHACRGSK